MNYGIDILGSIAILKFPEKTKLSEKKKVVNEILKMNNIKTVVEKLDKVKGRLRTIKTRFLAGEKTLETLYKESGCLFRLNIETCYFSPRLSNERLEVAKMIKTGKVLVMFAGVAPFPIVIAKHSKVEEITAVELGRECCKYAEKNILANKLKNVKIIQGDANKVVPKFKEKFDFVVMPRPQLKDTFLQPAFKVVKKNGKIIYYDFGQEPEEIVEKIKKEAGKAKKKIKIDKVKIAGDIGPHAHRWRVDMRVLN